MLNRLPRAISARYLHTIVLVLIAGSLMSFALGQQMAHGARTNTHAVADRIHGWVMAAPPRPAVAHTTARPSTALAVVSPESQPAQPKHHDKHHDGDQGGGDGGGGGG